MEIKSIGVISAGKISAAIYAVIMLFYGGIITLLALAGGLGNGGNGRMVGVGLGVGVAAIVIMPIVGAIFGFIGGVIWAAIYNLVAGMVGGLELTVDLGEPDRPY